jgi:hypothetical protein
MQRLLEQAAMPATGDRDPVGPVVELVAQLVDAFSSSKIDSSLSIACCPRAAATASTASR